MLGTLGGFLSVALGAFAAHGLKAQLTVALLSTFQTAVDYQFFHSLAIILLAITLFLKPNQKLFKIAGIAFLTGIILFSRPSVIHVHLCRNFKRR